MHVMSPRFRLAVSAFRAPLSFALLAGLAVAALVAGCGASEEPTSDTGEDRGSEASGATPTVAASPDTVILYAPSELTTTYLVDASNQPLHQWQSE